MHLFQRGHVVLALALAVAGPAAAQPAAPRSAIARPMPAAVVAVIDMQLILRESLVGRHIHRELERHRRSGQAEVTAREEALRRERDDLVRQRTILTPDAFAGRRQEFDRRAAEFGTYARRRQQQLEQALRNAMKEVERVGDDILQAIAAERGITLVMTRPTVLLSAKTLDVTQEVRQRLDRRLTRVEVRLPTIESN